METSSGSQCASAPVFRHREPITAVIAIFPASQKSRRQFYPITTVGQPSTMTPPCIVGSPIRAAIRFPIKTVGEPIAIVSGGPTHVHISVARAAGWPLINTVGQPGGRMGPPTCGIGGTPGVTIGQVCMSPTLAAGGIVGFRWLIIVRDRSVRLDLSNSPAPGFAPSPSTSRSDASSIGSCTQSFHLSPSLPLFEVAHLPSTGSKALG
jgi:hypothetical protein